MKKVLTLFISFFAFFVAHSQTQTILLLAETFDDGTNPMVFDSAGPGANFGNNDWIVNNLYIGQPIYPNTPNEDSVAAQLVINNAPLSNYLHIHDVAVATSNGIANDNWNTTTASDRFCYIGNSFCTLGMSSVQFTFDWICQGDSAAYGQVYYRSGTGPWVQTGQPKYYNQGDWIYESIQDTGMINKQNIQIGFRWVNSGNDSTTDVAFGVDDIFAVGTFNSADTSTAVTMHTVVNISTICQGNPVDFTLTLSNPLCDGTYELEMSDANGNFSDPYNLGILTLGPNFTTGFFSSISTDGTLSGNCFRIRTVRTSPVPVITSDTSACFSIIYCPPQITNVNAPVMHDPDTTCILSEIDVQFNSTGIFNADNVYIAELSDSTGSFADSSLLGTLPTRDSFPAIPPGDISGLIPASVPPGCGYYIRVRSTDPPVLGPLIGPYCLVRCDELTNNIMDLHFCVASGPYPSCDTINIAADHWNNQAQYDTCNNWIIQLRSMMDFSLVNSGGLGVYHDNVSGNFRLCMPSTADSLPVLPGSYYMRILSTCSNEPWNETGTVIRITIGAPNPVPPVISFVDGDSVFCLSQEPGLFVSPFNSPPSQYQWSSNLLNNGDAFIWPYDPLYINLSPNTLLGTYVFYVQEINYGCNGPSSAPADLTINGVPTVEISGPATVCVGDTDQYHVTFLKETYYSWTASPGVEVLNKSNVEATTVFDSIGTFKVSNYSLNACGADAGSIKVTVTPPYFTVMAGPDTTVCKGDSVTVQIEASALNKTFQVQDTGKLGKQGGMFNLIAHSKLTIDSFAVKLQAHPQNMEAEIYGKPGTYLSFEQNPAAWNLITVNYSNPTAPVGQMTIISADVGQAMQAGDTFAFYVTTRNTPALNIDYGRGTNVQGSVYRSDGNLDFVQGTVLDYSFINNLPSFGYILNVTVYYSTNSGYTYLWNNGDSSATMRIAPAQSENLSVLVSDHGLCTNRDSMHINIVPLPTVNAGPDTSVCPGQPYIMQGASSSPIVIWQPATGLDSVTNPHAIFNYDDSVTYLLIATDTQSHCSNRDTVNILVPLKLSIGPDTTVCDGSSDTLHAVSTSQNVVWSPSTGLNDSTVLEPVFYATADNGGKFTITATDKNGCKLSKSVNVNVEICNVVIVAPSAFTPSFSGNGSVEPDDHFIVWGKNVKEYEVKIYNRWGELVYNSGMLGALDDNFSPPLWDGRYKGKLQDTGTFVYYITGTDDNDKPVSKKGNLTLVR